MKTAIRKENQQESWKKIIWLFQILKTLTKTLAGAGVDLSGLLKQNLFQNPLAIPSVLGVSALGSFGTGTWIDLVLLAPNYVCRPCIFVSSSENPSTTYLP